MSLRRRLLLSFLLNTNRRQQTEMLHTTHGDAATGRGYAPPRGTAPLANAHKALMTFCHVLPAAVRESFETAGTNLLTWMESELDMFMWLVARQGHRLCLTDTGAKVVVKAAPSRLAHSWGTVGCHPVASWLHMLDNGSVPPTASHQTTEHLMFLFDALRSRSERGAIASSVPQPRAHPIAALLVPHTVLPHLFAYWTRLHASHRTGSNETAADGNEASLVALGHVATEWYRRWSAQPSMANAHAVPTIPPDLSKTILAWRSMHTATSVAGGGTSRTTGGSRRVAPPHGRNALDLTFTVAAVGGTTPTSSTPTVFERALDALLQRTAFPSTHPPSTRNTLQQPPRPPPDGAPPVTSRRRATAPPARPSRGRGAAAPRRRRSPSTSSSSSSSSEADTSDDDSSDASASSSDSEDPIQAIVRSKAAALRRK